MKRLACLSVIAIAGCPMPRAAQPSPQPAPMVAGCPAASQVYVAAFMGRDDGAPAGVYTGWVLPLFDRKVDSLANQPEYAPRRSAYRPRPQTLG
jgi:hypothetical protein